MAQPTQLSLFRQCSRCGEQFPPAEFVPRSARCKPCRTVSQRERSERWSASHPGKLKEAQDRWIAQNKDRRAATNKAWAERNPERVRAIAKRSQERNREQLRVYFREYRKRFPLHVRQMEAKYRMRKRGYSTAMLFTPEQLADKIAYWGDRCWMCQGPWTAIDHVKPISKGGAAHLLCNLRPACARCNGSKNNKWPFPTSSVKAAV